MPKSFLVKNKKGRPTVSSSLSGHEVDLATEEHGSGCKAAASTNNKVQTIGSTEGEKAVSPSLFPSPSPSPSPTLGNKRPSGIGGGENENLNAAAGERFELRRTSHRSQACSSTNNKNWWNDPESKADIPTLPPPPKLISTTPLGLNKNGFSKGYTIPERHPEVPLSLFHPSSDGYCVVSYCQHELPFGVRPPPDIHLDLSFCRRLPSDGLLEVSEAPLNSPVGRLPSDFVGESSFRRSCPNDSPGLLPSSHSSRDQSFGCRLSPEGCREASLCPNMSPCPQPLAGSPFFIPTLPFRPFESLSPPAKQSTQGRNVEGESRKDENKYKCDICSSTFSLQRLLNRHMKTHSFYKRYHCQYCGKGFNDTFDLKRHIRTHTGIKPFKCDRCDKSFTQRCSLEAHLTRVHSVVHKYGFRERRAKMFVCEDCGKTFTDNSEFMKHLHEMHPETEKLLRARRNSFSKEKLSQRSHSILH